MDAPPTDPAPPDAAPSEPVPPTADDRPPLRRLHRRLDGRLLGGVAGGVADALGVDVVLVRLGFVVATFFGGLGVIAYLVGWIVLPAQAPPDSGSAQPDREDRRQLLGYALVALGLLFVGGRLGWSFGTPGVFWPLVLVGLGGAVLWLRSRDSSRDPLPPPPTSVAATAVPRPPASAPFVDVREVHDSTATGTTAVTDTIPLAATARTAPTAAPPTVPVLAPPPTPRRRSYLGALTCCVLLLFAGGAWVLDAADVVTVDIGVMFALALAVVGGALVLSAWYGRSRGLILLGIPLVLVVGGCSVIDVPLDGGLGDPTYRPDRIAAVRSSYTLAAGDMTVDLRRVDFAGTRRHVEARVGVGELHVIVPSDVRVVVDGHASFGSITVFGASADTCCPSDVHRVSRGVPGSGTLMLDARVGAGHVGIEREEDRRGTS